MAKKIVITNIEDKDKKKGVKVELTEIDLKHPGDFHEMLMMFNMAKREIMRMRKEE